MLVIKLLIVLINLMSSLIVVTNLLSNYLICKVVSPTITNFLFIFLLRKILCQLYMQSRLSS
jgi:hypothetical protein